MLELIDCPDPNCHVVAEVTDLFLLPSTDEPVEHVATYCVNRHIFLLPSSRTDLGSGPPVIGWRLAKRSTREQDHDV